MNELSAQPADQHDFVLNNAQTLKTLGYNGKIMNALAARPATERDFVITHADQLRAAGYKFAFEITYLAASPDRRDAFLREMGHRS
ncbi:hypothetical protein ACFQDN_23180 [Pseudomonas asuensis]|uniref:Uncharacterized protein n=1 Tax=Pseudomonas asuensis TaxID=1825787 RepID=A0ABQ2H3M1_9PSED|nr:hypothetical protein [Pseudomonas asuensis]GGM32439.1 hypothetical protein GCM10009425_48660 [Pseudomonas asuensis]